MTLKAMSTNFHPNLSINNCRAIAIIIPKVQRYLSNMQASRCRFKYAPAHSGVPQGTNNSNPQVHYSEMQSPPPPMFPGNQNSSSPTNPPNAISSSTYPTFPFQPVLRTSQPVPKLPEKSSYYPQFRVPPNAMAHFSKCSTSTSFLGVI